MEEKDNIVNDSTTEEKNDMVNASTTEEKTPEDEVKLDTEAIETPVKKPLVERIKDLFSPEKRKKTIICLIACIAIICIVVGLIVYNSPDSVAKRYAEADSRGDLSTELSLVGYDGKAYFMYQAGCLDEEELFKLTSDYYDEDITSWRSLNKISMKVAKEEIEDDIGEYSCSSEVTRSKSMSAKKLISELGESYLSKYEKYGLDPDSISKGHQATVKLKYKGEDDTIKETYNIYLAKINGAWKVIKSSVDY